MYTILYDHPDQSLLTRLLTIRQITTPIEDFLTPDIARDWTHPHLLSDMRRGVERIARAVRDGERIMIFGDYDVDGMTSSSILYLFVKHGLGYNNISIRLPHRIHDGYGIRMHHIDEIIECGASLIVTVDNGITAIDESRYATERGIDMVITDHHKALERLPTAYATINPQISPDLPFKEIAGATVARKVAMTLADEMKLSTQKKQQMFDLLLPYAAIGTIADCCPLLHENRAIVATGLQMINTGNISRSLHGFLTKVGLPAQAHASHIGFIVGPKLNAAGRVGSPYEGLSALLATDTSLQDEHIALLDQRNTERRALQDELVKLAESLVDHEQPVLIAIDEQFHDGLVGIVAGRLSEKHHKPAIVLAKRDDHIVGSLRSPAYFSIINMLKHCDDLLLRYGGHTAAGGLTCSLESIDALTERIYAYAADTVAPAQTQRILHVDTPIHSDELHDGSIDQITQLAPFGEGNPEPLILIPDITITDVTKVGKRGNGHAKINATHDNLPLSIMMRGKGGDIDSIAKGPYPGCIGTIKADTYRGSGYFVEGKMLVDGDTIIQQ